MKEFPLKIYWVTTVWTKWQIIIPLEARNDMSINIANTYENKKYSIWSWECSNRF